MSAVLRGSKLIGKRILTGKLQEIVQLREKQPCFSSHRKWGMVQIVQIDSTKGIVDLKHPSLCEDGIPEGTHVGSMFWFLGRRFYE